ncbi:MULTISPECIES: hypothetical protein [unclassified Brevundimonas]|uniref:hypothetical protein n=1 Tax=unclassified Brevundimonas TaxID=2622653 RepID=UPI0006FD3A49|nr:MULTISPECIES: hypothetical protein [unclassified Brevundimonas]KQY95027.1 hypothetical protein ASD25_17055 [Brevundimonas sp. Root1423]KRA28513.1 hypothetical protein ASD59_01395 [Brevundimonas sp. Root608]
MREYRVRVSDRFLETATLAAVEAYSHGDGRKKRKEIETLGLVWGHCRTRAEETVIFLDRLAVSLSAEREAGSVMPNAGAISLMAEVMERLAPDQLLLGDFHSHPYRDLAEVQMIKGYEFSDGDFDAFLADDAIWDRTNNAPVMVVATVCRLGRVHESGGDHIRNNVWWFDVGQFRFWLNVCVGFLDEAGKRRHTGNKRSCVWLDLNSRFFNDSGDRVEA